MVETVVIDCPNCETKVRASVLAKKEYPQDEGAPYAHYFVECPGCSGTMVGVAEIVQVDYDEWDYEYPTRMWPNPKRTLDPSIPRTVRNSIDEAMLCLQVRAYSACAVMCGRALEALCKAHGEKQANLVRALNNLKEKGIIDGRLYEWGDMLRERRNIGAHATEEETSREDAVDVLDFTIAICEYVYVLTEKHAAFKARVAKRTQKRKKS